MNMIFHTTVAIGAMVGLTNTIKIEKSNSIKDYIKTGMLAFVLGIGLHGILDYIPHCYPLGAKLDVSLSCALMLLIAFFIKQKYWIIAGLSFLGNIFPDLIDLFPSILNNYISVDFLIIDNIFPWHYKKYSGSIYNADCLVSNINHAIVLLIIFIILYKNNLNIKYMIRRKTKTA